MFRQSETETCRNRDTEIERDADTQNQKHADTKRRKHELSDDSAHKRRKNINFPKNLIQTMIFRKTSIEINHKTQRDSDLLKYEGLG